MGRMVIIKDRNYLVVVNKTNFEMDYRISGIMLRVKRPILLLGLMD